MDYYAQRTRLEDYHFENFAIQAQSALREPRSFRSETGGVLLARLIYSKRRIRSRRGLAATTRQQRHSCGVHTGNTATEGTAVEVAISKTLDQGRYVGEWAFSTCALIICGQVTVGQIVGTPPIPYQSMSALCCMVICVGDAGVSVHLGDFPLSKETDA